MGFMIKIVMMFMLILFVNLKNGRIYYEDSVGGWSLDRNNKNKIKNKK